MKGNIVRSIGLFCVMTLLCGVVYTFGITGISQLLFKNKADGSVIEVDGKKYGSELLGQRYNDENHMWGRIVNVDTETFTDKEGKKVMYAWASNISPKSDEYERMVAERADKIRDAHLEKKDLAIPVDLVTCSGSGVDPHISVAAAEYQAERIAKNNNLSQENVYEIIEKCTTSEFLGVFGEKTVNVLKVNLMLDGILQ